MQQFTYTIKDRDGVHARPAGQLIAAASKFKSNITLSTNGKSVSLKGGIFALMGLGIRYQQEVTITCEGPDELDAYTGLKSSIEKLL
ncbi:MAG TPA: HPr family phosphocarrier protein [Candidatus Avisuccinivibrio pullicola]|nr:HPr family phosphocarrier protein [Candidatus Avisuccinivibrio pullicola]